MVGTAITAIGVAAGIGFQLQGMNKADDAAQEQRDLRNEASKKQLQFAKQMAKLNLSIQANKHKQDNLDYTRARRDIIRSTIQANAEQTARAAASGALYSSSYQGARAATLRESGRQQLDLYQNKQISDKIYATQKKIYGVEAKAGIVQSGFNQQIAGLETDVANGNNLARLGQALYSSADTLGNLAETFSASPDAVIDPFSASDWANSTTFGSSSSTTSFNNIGFGVR